MSDRYADEVARAAHEEFRLECEAFYDEAYGPRDQNTLEYNPSGSIWQRHASGGKRDHAADRRVRAEIQAEAAGEVDPQTGQWRACTWREA